MFFWVRRRSLQIALLWAMAVASGMTRFELKLVIHPSSSPSGRR